MDALVGDSCAALESKAAALPESPPGLYLRDIIAACSSLLVWRSQ